MRETEMSRQLKKLFAECDYSGFLMRIETGTRSGVPDLYYILDSSSGWIELKQCRQQKNLIIKIPYRPGQQGFLQEHLFCGGKSFVLLHLEDYTGVKKFYLINHNFNLKVLKNTASLKSCCCWQGNILNEELLHCLKRGF